MKDDFSLKEDDVKDYCPLIDKGCAGKKCLNYRSEDTQDRTSTSEGKIFIYVKRRVFCGYFKSTLATEEFKASESELFEAIREFKGNAQ